MKMMQLIKLYGSYKHTKKGEKGQVLLIVLVLMLVGITFVTSTMGFMSTSFKTNKVYVDNTVSLYASEAGIQDGIWNILNTSTTDLDTLLDPVAANPSPPAHYTDYDFNSYGWLYHLYDPNAGSASPININSLPVDITLKNVWVPLIKDDVPAWVPTATDNPPNLTPPSPAKASLINNNLNLIITGGVTTPPVYKINVTFNGTNNGTTSIPVLSIGCWLPQGFTYNNSSSNLIVGGVPLYASETVLSCSGNQAVVWTFNAKTFYSLQQSMSQTGVNLGITFQYTTSLAKVPEAMPWIVDGVTTNTDFPYAYTWDFDVKVFNLTGEAGNSAIEATIPKSETRALGNAISGDYVATGNSLLTMSSPNSNDVRTNLLSHSSAIVSDIPLDANLQGAYLYWTGWLNIGSFPTSAYPQVNFKVNGTQVYFNSSGQPVTGASALASTHSQNKWNGPTGSGYSYSCYRDVTALIRKVLHDASPSSTLLPGNATFDVGPAAGYHMADTGGTYQEWAYAGWSLVLIYAGPSTLGHQLYLYDTFTYADNVKDIDITGNTTGPGGTIGGFLVPAQVAGDVDAAKITACVGDGDFCYDSDFIAINAPSTYWSNPWNIPANSVYRLYDGINLPAYNNTPTNKNNVWNSYSQSGLSEGIDIKTFHITWASGLINPGDTSARIDVPTSNDSWSFIYMILSFRSSVTSGGSISYLIKRKNAP